MKFLRIFLLFIVCVLVVAALVRLSVILHAKAFTETTLEVKPGQVALVLGAGLNSDGTPTLVLRDRVRTAVDLYKSGKVQKLLMSGDNSRISYNEPEAMRQYAMQLGVPSSDIVLDYAGRRTYDSCARAKLIFKVEQLTIVTQAFHLPRAIFLCNKLGVNVEGVAAQQSAYNPYRFMFWNVREVAATLSAVWDIYVSPPKVVLGNPEPIFHQ